MRVISGASWISEIQWWCSWIKQLRSRVRCPSCYSNLIIGWRETHVWPHRDLICMRNRILWHYALKLMKYLLAIKKACLCRCSFGYTTSAILYCHHVSRMFFYLWHTNNSRRYNLTMKDTFLDGSCAQCMNVHVCSILNFFFVGFYSVFVTLIP